jgi:hypothetical protein
MSASAASIRTMAVLMLLVLAVLVAYSRTQGFIVKHGSATGSYHHYGMGSRRRGGLQQLALRRHMGAAAAAPERNHVGGNDGDDAVSSSSSSSGSSSSIGRSRSSSSSSNNPHGKKLDYAAILRAEMNLTDDLTLNPNALQSQQSKPLMECVTTQSHADIAAMVQCLNECATDTTQLAIQSDANRVCNWSKFDEVARQRVSAPKLTRNKASIRNWVIFHVRKGDIQHDVATQLWVWKPRRKKTKIRVSNSVTYYRRGKIK